MRQQFLKTQGKRPWTMLVVLIASFFCHPLLVCQAQEAATQREYTNDHPLVYEDAWDLWPYVFLDEKGEPQGYNVDLLTIIFDELNIPFVINLKPTSQALEDLREGKSDLMLGMYANYHDDYTTHYGKNVIQLFTHSVMHPRNEAQLIHSTEDLANHKVIVHEGSFSHHLMIDHGWGDNALPIGDMDKAIQLVSAEGNGLVLWNTMSLKWLMNKYHADDMMLSPVDMPSGDYRFMANDDNLLERLDNALDDLRASGRLTAIEAKWFYPEELSTNKQPRWLWFVVGAIGFMVLVLVFAILLFKARERIATREGRRRTSRLAQILNTCKVTVWTYDVQKKLFSWYESGRRVKSVLSTHDFASNYSEAGFKRLSKAISRIASMKDTDLQLQMQEPDGTGKVHYFTVNLTVLHTDREGQPAIIIGAQADDTAEQERQQQAVDMMHRYRAVFDTAMVDMVAYDKDGTIRNMNKRAQQTFQMNLDDVIKEGVKLRDILPEEEFKIDDFSSTDYFYSTLFLNYEQEKKLESRKREGRLFYELLLVPVFDDAHQLTGAYGTGREVSEVASTYHRAQQSVAQLRTTMQNVADHVNNINYALQAGGVRMVTYSPLSHMLTIKHRIHEVQYVLTQQRCIALTAPDSMRTVMRAFRTMDRRTPTTVDIEVGTNLRLPGGSHLWLHMLFYPSYNAEGKLMHYSGICRDTTDIKHTEHMLLLETEKAQEIEQVKSKFLHNMCYEIRTPLDTVVSCAEKFENEHTPEEEAAYIEQIKDNSSYLLNLINDILFLSRLDARMVEMKRQPCDFAKTFESHCHMGISHREKEGVKYIVENQYEQLVVNIDDMNVGRIIQQVLANSVTYTEHGYVRARYEYIGGKLIIAIEDTGIGIAPEKLEHIFERFNSSQNEMHGTGLGMPICHELAEQLGGTIDINSEVGKGTTVWITIPCEATIVEHKKED